MYDKKMENQSLHKKNYPECSDKKFIQSFKHQSKFLLALFTFFETPRPWLILVLNQNFENIRKQYCNFSNKKVITQATRLIFNKLKPDCKHILAHLT